MFHLTLHMRILCVGHISVQSSWVPLADRYRHCTLQSPRIRVHLIMQLMYSFVADGGFSCSKRNVRARMIEIFQDEITRAHINLNSLFFGFYCALLFWMNSIQNERVTFICFQFCQCQWHSPMHENVIRFITILSKYLANKTDYHT